MSADWVSILMIAAVLGGCAGAPCAEGPVVVAFGDSITLGSGVKPEESYPAQLQALLREQTAVADLKVVNAGVGGNTVTQGLTRLEADVLAHQPRAVLIGFGMNDSVMVAAGQPRVPLETFSATLTEVVRRVQATGAQALLATVTPVLEEYYFERHPRDWYPDPEGLQPQLQRYSDAIRSVAGQTGATLVDLSCLKAAVHLRTPQNSGARDGVHPTPAGYAVMARAYAEALRALPWTGKP